MANKANDQRLFDYIHSLGEVVNYKESLVIMNNTGLNAKEGCAAYRCFLLGGIQFEIDNFDNEYWLEISWRGPFNAVDSTDILATLIWLKHEVK